jgi:cytochrome c oxidase cbb3-type subunit 3
MKTRVPSYVTIFFIIIVIFFVFYVFSGENFDYIKHPIFTFVIIITLILLFIIEILNKYIYNQKIKIFTKTKKKRNMLIKHKQHNYFYRLYEILFLDAKKKNIIDHGFDSILELDNELPSLWLNLFYITIIVAGIYFFAYIFTDFAHPDKEYDLSYKKQLSEIQSYENTITQATLETANFDESFIEEGKNLFDENCATCHESNGRGNIGPNLTDDYWINKEEKSLFKNIFHVIWYGSKNNSTMRAFGESGEIKGNDIQKIASYVYSINKEPKKPIHSKDPQGKKVTWEED